MNYATMNADEIKQHFQNTYSTTMVSEIDNGLITIADEASRAPPAPRWEFNPEKPKVSYDNKTAIENTVISHLPQCDENDDNYETDRDMCGGCELYFLNTEMTPVYSTYKYMNCNDSLEHNLCPVCMYCSASSSVYNTTIARQIDDDKHCYLDFRPAPKEKTGWVVVHENIPDLNYLRDDCNCDNRYCEVCAMEPRMCENWTYARRKEKRFLALEHSDYDSDRGY